MKQCFHSLLIVCMQTRLLTPTGTVRCHSRCVENTCREGSIVTNSTSKCQHLYTCSELD